MMSIDQTNKPRGWTHIAERFQHSFDQVWAHVPKVRRNEAGHDKLGFTLYSSYCAWRLPGSRLFRTKKSTFVIFRNMRLSQVAVLEPFRNFMACRHFSLRREHLWIEIIFTEPIHAATASNRNIGAASLQPHRIGEEHSLYHVVAN